MSLPLLGGVALGAVTVLLVTASLLDASRRSGALAVVDTRAGMLEGQDRVLLNETPEATDRKSTRLNSSHVADSYAGVCSKKKKERRLSVDIIQTHVQR